MLTTAADDAAPTPAPARHSGETPPRQRVHLLHGYWALPVSGAGGYTVAAIAGNNVLAVGEESFATVRHAQLAAERYALAALRRFLDRVCGGAQPAVATGNQ